MSQEPHPRTGRARAGSTPAPQEGARPELERQRAESGMPGQPTTDAFDRDEGEGSAADDDGSASSSEVPPEESVPDDVAEQAVEDEAQAALQDPPRDDVQTSRDEDVMHRSASSGGATGVPAEPGSGAPVGSDDPPA